MTQIELLEAMRQSVIDGSLETAKHTAGQWLSIAGANPLEAVERGFTPGIEEVGRLYEEGEYFLPELIASAEAMKAALNVLRPAITSEAVTLDKGVVVLATVEGDIHEIGKSIVGALLEANGYKVHDLGANVSLDLLCRKIKEVKPHVVGLSALLTTTMMNQRKAVFAIRNEGFRVKIIVGGAPVTEKWAWQIGADGYGKDAFQAVEIVDDLLYKD